MWRHVIGSDPSDDVCVYCEDDESFYIGISRSRSERLLYIHSGGLGTSFGGTLARDHSNFLHPCQPMFALYSC